VALEYHKVIGQLTGELTGADVSSREVIVVVPAAIPLGEFVPLHGYKVSEPLVLNAPKESVVGPVPEVLDAEFEVLEGPREQVEQVEPEPEPPKPPRGKKS
jgi:hypothetical protein